MKRALLGRRHIRSATGSDLRYPWQATSAGPKHLQATTENHKRGVRLRSPCPGQSFAQVRIATDSDRWPLLPASLRRSYLHQNCGSAPGARGCHSPPARPAQSKFRAIHPSAPRGPETFLQAKPRPGRSSLLPNKRSSTLSKQCCGERCPVRRL